MLISKFITETNVESIELFEMELMINLPMQYKKFLYKYNGGETPGTTFRINRVSSDLNGFYGVAIYDRFYDFNQIKNLDIFKELLVDGYLLIGDTVFGDYILIGLKEENIGKIFFYYHDRPKKLIELTENFQAFINKCKSKKIGKVESIEERTQALIKDGKNPDYIKPALIKVWQDEIDDYTNIHQEDLVLESPYILEGQIELMKNTSPEIIKGKKMKI